MADEVTDATPVQRLIQEPAHFLSMSVSTADMSDSPLLITPEPSGDLGRVAFSRILNCESEVGKLDQPGVPTSLKITTQIDDVTDSILQLDIKDVGLSAFDINPVHSCIDIVDSSFLSRVRPLHLHGALASSSAGVHETAERDLSPTIIAGSSCHSTTPRTDFTNHTNFLFDSSPYPSPLTQPVSTTTIASASVSVVSVSNSPTRHSTTPYGKRRSVHRRLHNYHHAACSLYTRAQAPSSRGSSTSSASPKAKRKQVACSLTALLGVIDDVVPRVDTIQGIPDLGFGADPYGVMEPGLYPDDDSVMQMCSSARSERPGAALSLMQRALALQRQSVFALQLQLKDLRMEHDDLEGRALEGLEKVARLERSLEQVSRERDAMAAQRQLLEQQLWDMNESWRDEQLALQAHRQGQQEAGRCNADQDDMGSHYDSSRSSIFGADTPRAMGPGSGDARDLAIAALERENQALTQRLIASNLALAQAREQEECSRHEVHMLREMNQAVMETVNRNNLELSLLRPNAGGRSRGIFSNLPFLRSPKASPKPTSA